MTHIRVPSTGELPWYLRPLFWLQRRRYGSELQPARIWATSPRLLIGFALFHGALDRRSSPLEPRLRALVTVRVSQINWCAFCVDLNSALLLERGGGRLELSELERFESSDAFSEREKAALAYAEAVTHSERGASAKHFDRLREHFEEAAIVELTALAAFQNLSSKFNTALDVPGQGFCELPANEKARSLSKDPKLS